MSFPGTLTVIRQDGIILKIVSDEIEVAEDEVLLLASGVCLEVEAMIDLDDGAEVNVI